MESIGLEERLIIPFTWEERRPHYADRVLFVPTYYADHSSFGSLNLLAEGKPVFVEYCSGNGDWVVEKAKQSPECLWIAVEKRFDRVQKIWKRRLRQGLSNLVIVYGDAVDFSKYYLGDQVVSGCFVNFPDPWPKGKHAKHRIFQKPFIDQLYRLLQARGRVTIATDDPLWAERILAQFRSAGGFESLFGEFGFTTEWPDYGVSYFDQLWRCKGKTIYYLNFEKIEEGAWNLQTRL